MLSSRNGEEGLTFDPSCIRIAKVIGERPPAEGIEETKGLNGEEENVEMSTKEQRPEDSEVNNEKRIMME